MGKLTDILHGSVEELQSVWDETEAAGEFGALPAGEYVARIVAGELENSKSNATPGYKLTFAVLEGGYAGRKFWHDLWLTPAAMAMTKRDLLKLSVSDFKHLENPLPKWIRCKVKLALRRDDNGAEYNRVVRFDPIGIDTPEADEFAPADDPPSTGDDSAEQPETLPMESEGSAA